METWISKKVDYQYYPPNMSNKLPNYLRTFRKRSGLSQAEVAFLLGCEHGTKISRYERQQRIPNLKTVLALEVVYKTMSKHLFEGVYHEIEYQVKERVAILHKQITKKETTPTTLHKLRSLKELLDELSN
ncbi:MAG: helix-turn-helix transcriptional regulator [Bacteroidota bacterium]